jgi:hypothetical protein
MPEHDFLLQKCTAGMVKEPVEMCICQMRNMISVSIKERLCMCSWQIPAFKYKSHKKDATGKIDESRITIEPEQSLYVFWRQR